MSNSIIPFDYHGQQVRVTGTKENPLWVLKDVCDVLDIKNPTDVSKRLDPDEVTRLNLGGLSGVVNVVTESGLYAVILRSDKPEAKPFRKWVTSEVLPSIRETFVTQTTAHGHGKAVPDVRYSEKVRNQVLQWLEEHNWPTPIIGSTGKKFYVAYQQIAA